MAHPPLESLEAQLRQLETDLLRADVRRDPRKLALLLADEFHEFGSSGRIYTKREALDLLPSAPPADISILEFSVTLLATDVALVRYQAAKHSADASGASVSLRSSVWVLRDSRWQMLFHQGTRVGP